MCGGGGAVQRPSCLFHNDQEYLKNDFFYVLIEGYLPFKKDVELKPRDEDLLSVRTGRGGLGFGISDGIVFIFSKLASFHILREQHPFIFSPS